MNYVINVWFAHVTLLIFKEKKGKGEFVLKYKVSVIKSYRLRITAR